MQGHLGGGNSNICYFHSYLGKISNLTNIFRDGLVQPPTSHFRENFQRYPPQKDNKKTPFPTKRGTPGTHRLKVSAG